MAAPDIGRCDGVLTGVVGIMKLVAISDTHGEHGRIEPGQGDVLVHAGDITLPGDKETVVDFLHWFARQPFTHKVFIAGNHDFCLEQSDTRPMLESLARELGVVYLNDSGVEIGGLKFWGSPVTPTFMDWAFMRDSGAPLEQHWANIPADTDVLVTHGPPLGCRDALLEADGSSRSVGCRELRDRIAQVKPRLHIFGHIHEGYGASQSDDGTVCLNASSLDAQYALINRPLGIELEARDEFAALSSVSVGG